MRSQHDYGADRSAVVAVVTPVPIANGFYWVSEVVSPLREACKTTLLPLITPKLDYEKKLRKDCLLLVTNQQKIHQESHITFEHGCALDYDTLRSGSLAMALNY
jgi:hypothetical protein